MLEFIAPDLRVAYLMKYEDGRIHSSGSCQFADLPQPPDDCTCVLITHPEFDGLRNGARGLHEWHSPEHAPIPKNPIDLTLSGATVKEDHDASRTYSADFGDTVTVNFNNDHAAMLRIDDVPKGLIMGSYDFIADRSGIFAITMTDPCCSITPVQLRVRPRKTNA